MDGMTVSELCSHIVEKKREITTQIRQRKYQPSPVLRVDIPKDYRTMEYKAKPHQSSVNSFKYKIRELRRKKLERRHEQSSGTTTPSDSWMD